jgi:hypothetical protein
MVVIWLRGRVLRRQITDRKYRLALRAAATATVVIKALRAPCGPTPQYEILYCLITRRPPPRAPRAAAAGYGWIGHKPGAGLSDMPRPALGVFAPLDRF